MIELKNMCFEQIFVLYKRKENFWLGGQSIEQKNCFWDVWGCTESFAKLRWGEKKTKRKKKIKKNVKQKHTQGQVITLVYGNAAHLKICRGNHGRLG